MRKEVIGQATIYLADCLAVLPSLGDVGAVISDPPYGIAHKHSGCSGRRWKKVNVDAIAGDESDFDPAPVLIAPAILFGADHFSSRLPAGGVFHVWDKECGRSGRNDSFSDAEIFWTSWQCKRVVVRYLWKGLQVEEPTIDQVRQHPTQKPVAVMRKLVSMAPAGTVLDPYMGTGTTGAACASLNRPFIGVEIDPKYFDIACERIENAQRQERLFG